MATSDYSDAFKRLCRPTEPNLKGPIKTRLDAT